VVKVFENASKHQEPVEWPRAGGAYRNPLGPGTKYRPVFVDVLAHRTALGVATMRKFENGVHNVHRNNMSAVIREFEEAGVEFIERTKSRGPGLLEEVRASIVVLPSTILGIDADAPRC
jgi:hypothetical protein